MKIQKKLLLLAIASVVVPTSIVQASDSITPKYWGGTVATNPSLALAKQSAETFQSKLEANVQQLKDFETTLEFKEQSGKVVGAHRKLKAAHETALAHTKAHKTHLKNHEERLNALNSDYNKLMTARQKQVNDDTINIAEKQQAKNSISFANLEEPRNKVPSYNTQGRKMVGGSAGL